jgi:hypothetical protein
MTTLSDTQKHNIMLEAMKSYTKTKINETKKEIQQKQKKPKSGMTEDLNIGDELSFGVKHHE